MGRYKKYTDEFKREVLAMVAEGTRSVAQIERDLDLTPGLIYKWQQRYRVQDTTLQPSEERAEQAELRRRSYSPPDVHAGADSFSLRSHQLLRPSDPA